MPLMSSEDIGRYRDVNFGSEDVEEESDEVKKCNLLKFLRLKAHIHYRTIIHLFFISGIILVILMFLSLTLKVNKRRNALRRFANKRNIDVASIDSAVAKQREAEGLSPRPQRSFRLGNLMLTFEQRMAPPAYDQVVLFKQRVSYKDIYKGPVKFSFDIWNMCTCIMLKIKIERELHGVMSCELVLLFNYLGDWVWLDEWIIWKLKKNPIQNFKVWTFF